MTRTVEFIEDRLVKRSQLRTSQTGYQCLDNCTCVDQFTNKYLEKMCASDLFFSRKVCTASFNDIFINLRSVGVPQLFGLGGTINNPAARNPSRCGSGGCLGWRVPWEAREACSRLASDLQKEIHGPCLDCYTRSGKMVVTSCEHVKSFGRA